MTDDPRDPFEMVDSPFGRLPLWKADAFAIGALNALYNKIRNDSAASGIGAEPDPEAGELSAAVLEGVKSMMDAIGRLEARVDGLEQSQCDRHRLDEQAELAERLKLPPQAQEDDDFAVGQGAHAGGAPGLPPPVEEKVDTHLPGEEEDAPPAD